MRLRRRTFIASGVAWTGVMPFSPSADVPGADRFEEIEKQLGGRLGLAAVNTGTGARLTYRASERFAMCSTFKWMLAAAVLAKVHTEHADLEQSLSFRRADLVDFSPVTRAHVDE